jgi:hypothetical protein
MLNEREDAGSVGVHVEAEAGTLPCVEEPSVLRGEKDKACEKLRQCVDTLERNAEVDENVHEIG